MEVALEEPIHCLEDGVLEQLLPPGGVEPLEVGLVDSVDFAFDLPAKDADRSLVCVAKDGEREDHDVPDHEDYAHFPKLRKR